MQIGPTREGLIGVDEVRKVGQIVRMNDTNADGLVHGREVVSTVSDVEELPVIWMSPIVFLTSRRQQFAGGSSGEWNLLCTQADVPIHIIF